MTISVGLSPKRSEGRRQGRANHPVGLEDSGLNLSALGATDGSSRDGGGEMRACGRSQCLSPAREWTGGLRQGAEAQAGDF